MNRRYFVYPSPKRNLTVAGAAWDLAISIRLYIRRITVLYWRWNTDD